MKKILIAAILGCFLTLSASAEWLPIAKGVQGVTYEGLSQSMHYETTESGVPIAVIDGRILKKGTTQFVQWSVPREDCPNRKGNIYTLAPDTNEILEKNFFVFDGGNIISEVGQTICTVVNINTSRGVVAPSHSK